MVDHMLTTIDNPYDPFSRWEEWLQYDKASGYNTIEYLARITRSSDELSEVDQALAEEQAIDEIVSENILGIYRKVSKDSFET